MQILSQHGARFVGVLQTWFLRLQLWGRQSHHSAQLKARINRAIRQPQGQSFWRPFSHGLHTSSWAAKIGPSTIERRSATGLQASGLPENRYRVKILSLMTGKKLRSVSKQKDFSTVQRNDLGRPVCADNSITAACPKKKICSNKTAKDEQNVPTCRTLRVLPAAPKNLKVWTQHGGQISKRRHLRCCHGWGEGAYKALLLFSRDEADRAKSEILYACRQGAETGIWPAYSYQRCTR